MFCQSNTTHIFGPFNRRDENLGSHHNVTTKSGHRLQENRTHILVKTKAKLWKNVSPVQIPASNMDMCDSSVNIFTETPRMESGSLLYLPSMYDSDDEDEDNVTLTRDDHIKKVKEEDQQRRGSRYALLRCLAWSQDEDTEESPGDRMTSQSTVDPAVHLTMVADVCTISSTPASEKTLKSFGLHQSRILWAEQVSSEQDLATIICGVEKQ